jgi:hypothetical protein
MPAGPDIAFDGNATLGHPGLCGPRRGWRGPHSGP